MLRRKKTRTEEENEAAAVDGDFSKKKRHSCDEGAPALKKNRRRSAYASGRADAESNFLFGLIWTIL